MTTPARTPSALSSLNFSSCLLAPSLLLYLPSFQTTPIVTYMPLPFPTLLLLFPISHESPHFVSVVSSNNTLLKDPCENTSVSSTLTRRTRRRRKGREVIVNREERGGWKQNKMNKLRNNDMKNKKNKTKLKTSK